ncbi:hypothetical protein [Deinococcus radiotolerans]|uniref:ASCH domain-containing protein n=1 Tax=Deinococcus radiotolerans TaxID=1309407 RepID=A0ABQ2FPZ1_9DEIO|nr:hypothetical protein [Deinococcus radiotolerans]GGL15499.1 hypothetical protein GCM10010844_37950 [Deinococcus radiotolerans]
MTTPLLRGITLTHPWAWCVGFAGKDIENRSWHPERQGGRVGMYLAIHGGAVPDGGARKTQQLEDLAYVQRYLLDIDQRAEATWERVAIPGIVAVARLAAVTQTSTSIWAAHDQYHWQLADVVTLPEPIAHRGAQGLWQVQPDVHKTLARFYRDALKGG